MVLFRKCIHGVKFVKLAPDATHSCTFDWVHWTPMIFIKKSSAMFGLKFKSCHVWITNIADNVLKEGCTVLCSADVIPD